LLNSIPYRFYKPSVGRLHSWKEGYLKTNGLAFGRKRDQLRSLPCRQRVNQRWATQPASTNGSAALR